MFLNLPTIDWDVIISDPVIAFSLKYCEVGYPANRPRFAECEQSDSERNWRHLANSDLENLIESELQCELPSVQVDAGL